MPISHNRPLLSSRRQAPWPWPWSVWGFDAQDRLGGGTATLAVLEGDAAKHVERILGRRVGWRRTGVELREAVGRAIGTLLAATILPRGGAFHTPSHQEASRTPRMIEHLVPALQVSVLRPY